MTASYDGDFDEIVVEMVLCANADNRTSYHVYFDHEDTTNLDGDGIDDGPDTLDTNLDCVVTFDDKMTHKGSKDSGPGFIDVLGSILTFRVGIDELNPFLMPFDIVLIWTDTKLKNVTDKAPNTEPGDGCDKPEVPNEVLSLILGVMSPTGTVPQLPTGKVKGTVRNSAGAKVGGILVTTIPLSDSADTTNNGGKYNIGDVPAGTASMIADCLSGDQTEVVTVIAGATVTVDFNACD